MKLDPEETWFIGDTFEIDVVGAKNSGWHVIWSTIETAQCQKEISFRT